MIEKIRELISNGEQFTGFVYDLDGSTDISSSQWISEIELFNETYLKKHPLNNRIQRLCFHKKTDKTCSELLGVLRTLEKDFSTTLATETESELIEEKKKSIVSSKPMKSKVFIVHGHDDLAKTETARFIEKLGFEAIILHEQVNQGQTIIEKIETNTEVDIAIVLYTPCDIGGKNEATLSNRARQNVVFEHGYLIAKLGRNNVIALVKEPLEKPSDISGIVYETLDDKGAWKYAVAKELKEIGFNVDFNKI